MTNPPPGPMVSISHRYRWKGYCGHCSAPIVTSWGTPCGVYIDDTTPNRWDWVLKAVVHHPGQKVFVGVGPYETLKELADNDTGVPGIEPPQVIRLREILYWGMGLNWHDVLPTVKPCGQGNGYFVQWNWWGLLGHRAPTWEARMGALNRARQFHPSYIFIDQKV